MAYESIILIAQAASVFFLAAWLSTGVFENLFYSTLNSTFTAEVLEMSRMRDEYPEAYALVAHRRITNPKIQILLFRLIVFWELIALLTLWTGVVLFGLAMVDMATAETALAIGLLGALLFTATWAGFLIAGNWFCYWFCHEGAQNTHYQMTFWGLGTMIFLVAA